MVINTTRWPRFSRFAARLYCLPRLSLIQASAYMRTGRSPILSYRKNGAGMRSALRRYVWNIDLPLIPRAHLTLLLSFELPELTIENTGNLVSCPPARCRGLTRSARLRGF